MRRDEALHVLTAATYADGGCVDCFRTIVGILDVLMPNVPWAELAEEAWRRHDTAPGPSVAVTELLRYR